MRQRSLGWSSGRSVGRSPAWRALKAARLIGRWADLWLERSRYAGGVPLLAVLALIATAANPAPAQDLRMPISPIWGVPEVGALPDDAHGRLVRRGRDLITATYAHIGPEVADPAKRYAGNNLACRNCHLEAGTKRFGLPLWGLFDRYPRYSSETGGEITLEQRVNACISGASLGIARPFMLRSMQALARCSRLISPPVSEL